jgi:ADP-heptose:LPS heptosyltransferase
MQNPLAKNKVLKNIDSIVAHFLLRFVSQIYFNSEFHGEILNVLVIRPGGIGDAVHMVPMLLALKKNNSKILITLLVEQRNVGVVSLITGIHRVLCYDKPMELLHTIRANFDAVIDTEQWHRLSAVVARMTRSPITIGFGTNERLRMFTHQVPYSHEEYETLNFAQLLKPLGIEIGGIDSCSPFLSIPKAVASRVTLLLNSLFDQLIVTVFPGSSIAERRWGANRFRRVAEMLKSLGFAVVVVGGEDDQMAGEEICAGNIGLNLAGQTSLAETAAIIQKSALLISGDSGVLHIAVGLNVPTVSLFGPGRAKKWAPRGERHIVINKDLPCSPCTTFGNTPPCPINAKCMSDISVEEVFEAVKTLLVRTGSVTAETL